MSTALKDIAALADKMRARARAAGDLAARAACYAVPFQPYRQGINHEALWPGALAEFCPGAPVDNLKIAAAFLLLEIERLEKPATAAAA